MSASERRGRRPDGRGLGRPRARCSTPPAATSSTSAAAPEGSRSGSPSSATGSPWSTPAPTRWPPSARRAEECAVADRVTGAPGRPLRAARPGRGPAAPTWCCATASSRSSTTRPRRSRRSPTVLRPGGTLSLLVAQRHAAVVARAMAGHFRPGPSPARRLGDPDRRRRGPRRFTADEVAALLDGAGFDRRPARGPGLRRPGPGTLVDLEPGAAQALVELEQAVADRPEYLPSPPSSTSSPRRAEPRAGAAGRPVTDRAPTTCHAPARRHGRVLRLREVRDRPELPGRPGRSSAAATAGSCCRPTTGPARYGVRSAMPTTRARRLCPTAVVVPPDYDAFTEVSASVMEIFRRGHPAGGGGVAGRGVPRRGRGHRRLGSPADDRGGAAARVYDEQGITCSVGVAGTVSVAKLASRRGQARRRARRAPGGGHGFLHPLDVGSCGGWGRRPPSMLHRLGLRTVGDLAHTPLRDPAARARLGLGQPAARARLGRDRRVSRPRRVPDGARTKHGRTTRPSAVTPTTRRWSAASCCGWPRRSPAGCGSRGVAGRTVTLQGPVRRLHHDHPLPDPAARPPT